MKSTREALAAFIGGLPIVSTHEHHRDVDWYRDMTLEKLFASSYVEWAAAVPADPRGRAGFLAKVSANSYFVWLSRGLERVYGLPALTVDNWDEWSAAIGRSHAANADFHIDILRRHAGYEAAIQDSFWSPGSDVGRPDMFKPTFRINNYVICHHPDLHDHDGVALWGDDFAPHSFDEYLELLRRDVAAAKARGAVALKSAIAYERPILFRPVTRAAAARAFNRRPEEAAPEAVTAFGDYVMDYLCGLAAEFDLPFQHHTGLGLLAGSNPLGLDYLINKHPGTKFVLFHGGYPWTGEFVAMGHNYANVILDLCWLPLISTSAAIRTLRECLEAGINGHRICWGGDCQSSEESVGAVLAFRHVLALALSDLVDEGYLAVAAAEGIAAGISHLNARAIYGLGCRPEAFSGRRIPPGSPE